MPIYQYKARDKQSRKAVRGTVQATNQAAAAKQLRAKGLIILSISASQGLMSKPFLVNPIASKDRIVFARELAVMVQAGLPIMKALKALQEQTDNKALAQIIRSLIKEVDGGTSLSEAFSHYPQAFPPIFVSVARIGEKSGKLEQVLNRLADQLEKDDELTSKVVSALIYPVFILVSLVTVMIVIMVYIIPQLRNIFEDAGVPLPVLTQIMLQLSSFMQRYIIIILTVIATIIIGTKLSMRRPIVAHFMETALLHIPVVGKLQRQVLMTRFSHTMSTLLSAGLPMIDALQTTAQVMNSPTYQISSQQIIRKVENGGTLSEALLTDNHFPPMVGHMVAIGEGSGNTDEILETIGLFFDKDVDKLTRNLSASLEPLLMLAIGLGVGLVVASVIIPMYGLVNAM